jgi:hypothetical protein
MVAFGDICRAEMPNSATWPHIASDFGDAPFTLPADCKARSGCIKAGFILSAP